MSQLAAVQASPAQAAALYQSQEKLESSSPSLFADMLTAAQAADAAASKSKTTAAAQAPAAQTAESAAASAAQAADTAAAPAETTAAPAETAAAAAAETTAAPAETAAAAAAETTAAPAEAAAAATAETAATAASTGASSSGSSILSSMLPFFLASMSSGSGGQAMLMLLALAMVADSGDSGEGESLVSDLFSSMSDSGGNLGTSLLTSSLMGAGGLWGSGNSNGGLWGTDSNDSNSWGGLNASSMATMAAAQSMMQAYRNARTGTPSPYATGPVPFMDDDGNIHTSTPVANTNFSTYTTLGEDTDEPVGSDKAPGRRVTPEVMSTVGNRSPSLYRQVIDQFDVENNPRYAVNQKGTGDTYCNIFMWDVTCAMGAEIPHHTDWDTGAPLASGGKSMNANRISDWLNTYGPQYGWYEVTPEQAQALANRGSPAVTVWKNPEGGHGHVQVVSPSESGSYDPEKGVAIAQAGTRLRNYTYITNIYSSRMKDVQYFAHR